VNVQVVTQGVFSGLYVRQESGLHRV
jgi:hypothetical protein